MKLPRLWSDKRPLRFEIGDAVGVNCPPAHLPPDNPYVTLAAIIDRDDGGEDVLLTYTLPDGSAVQEEWPRRGVWVQKLWP